MQVLEFQKKDGWIRTAYSVSLVVGLGQETDLESEFRQMRAALFDWRARRGAQGNMVLVVFSGEPALHATAEAMLEHLYRDSPELGFLQSVEVRVSLLDNAGAPIKQYQLQPGRN